MRQKILFVIVILFSIHRMAFSQSVLLIKSETKVYDTHEESRVTKLTVEEDTWINYKGTYGDYVKISNFFGKDKRYPMGVFEGFVHINSVLDTASRKEIETGAIHLTPGLDIGTELKARVDDQNSSGLKVSAEKSDIDLFYLGMTEQEAKSLDRAFVNFENHKYEILLSFNSSKTLSKITMKGPNQDALAVDGLIKNQIFQLQDYFIKKYGRPTDSATYPGFLELEENKIKNITKWNLPDKTILLGVGEQNDLFYPSVLQIKN